MVVNEAIDIPWVGPIGLTTVDGQRVSIPEPSAHTGMRPVRIRILSSAHRDGLNASIASGGNCLPRSRYLLIHCHGGGYVATSSKSHEVLVSRCIYDNHYFIDISSNMGKTARLYSRICRLFIGTRKSISTSDRRSALCLCMGDYKSRQIRLDRRKSRYGWRFSWRQLYVFLKIVCILIICFSGDVRQSSSRSVECCSQARRFSARIYAISISILAFAIATPQFHGSITAYGRRVALCCRYCMSLLTKTDSLCFSLYGWLSTTCGTDEDNDIVGYKSMYNFA